MNTIKTLHHCKNKHVYYGLPFDKTICPKCNSFLEVEQFIPLAEHEKEVQLLKEIISKKDVFSSRYQKKFKHGLKRELHIKLSDSRLYNIDYISTRKNVISKVDEVLRSGMRFEKVLDKIEEQHRQALEDFSEKIVDVVYKSSTTFDDGSLRIHSSVVKSIIEQLRDKYLEGDKNDKILDGK